MRDSVLSGLVELKQTWTEHQVADIFTKCLDRQSFLRYRGPLMGYQTYEDMVKAHPKPIPVKVGALQADEVPPSPMDENTRFADSYVPNTIGKWPSQVIPVDPDSWLASYTTI